MPNAFILLAIADLLEVSLDYLLGRSGSPEIRSQDDEVYYEEEA